VGSGPYQVLTLESSLFAQVLNRSSLRAEGMRKPERCTHSGERLVAFDGVRSSPRALSSAPLARTRLLTSDCGSLGGGRSWGGGTPEHLSFGVRLRRLRRQPECRTLLPTGPRHGGLLVPHPVFQVFSPACMLCGAHAESSWR
jgi:hypothetical protein